MKYADYIKQIDIDSLWSGKKHIVWNLNRQVNILSGVNGVGKSTILNKVVKGLKAGGEFPSHMMKGVRLKVEPEDAKWIRYDVIRSFDRPLLDTDTISKLNVSLATELDFQIFQLQRKYLDYQVNIGNRMIAILQAVPPMPPYRHNNWLRPKRCSKTSSTTFLKTLARPLYVPKTRYVSHSWAKCWCPISCRVARSRCWPSCSPCWLKTNKTMFYSWTSPR